LEEDIGVPNFVKKPIYFPFRAAAPAARPPAVVLSPVSYKLFPFSDYKLRPEYLLFGCNINVPSMLFVKLCSPL
jgi:hypothetical protein